MDPGIVGSKLEYDIIITKQDVMEFLSMQELCITIIQVFVKFADSLCCDREIDDRFGFLCPNAVQSVGNTREERISYIGSTIKEGNKQCWLAPIHEGNHWTLCAICLESNIIYWFDSLGREQSDDIEKIFTEALEMYHIIGEKNTKWLRVNYRRQVEDKECGYYVMGYMYDIIDLDQVHSLDTHFNNPQCYSQEDINFIRNMWSNYFLELRLMGLDSDEEEDEDEDEDETRTTKKRRLQNMISERQQTHSHAVLDIDGLRRVSTVCRRLTFPISIYMDPGIVGSKLEYDIIITKQDVMEFLSMQELCVTIIQVFVMFANSLCCDREIDDRFGFLCPNAVQSVGNTREDRISYIGSTIKEGNKQCWLAPILEGNHWTLCVIFPESNIIYWFDSLGREQGDDIEKLFTEALKMYHVIGEKNTKWLRPNYRHQLGNDKECGYYIMRYMYDIIDLNQVHSLDMHFNNPQCYSQEDIDNIRSLWADYFLRFAEQRRERMSARVLEEWIKRL